MLQHGDTLANTVQHSTALTVMALRFLHCTNPTPIHGVRRVSICMCMHHLHSTYSANLQQHVTSVQLSPRVPLLLRLADKFEASLTSSKSSLLVSCMMQETDILYFHTQVHKLQPGFYVAVSHEDKTLMWVIRGTHDIHDILTDLCGVATPIPGGAAHWGMWRAAGWLLDTQWARQAMLCCCVLAYLQVDTVMVCAPGWCLKSQQM